MRNRIVRYYYTSVRTRYTRYGHGSPPVFGLGRVLFYESVFIFFLSIFIFFTSYPLRISKSIFIRVRCRIRTRRNPAAPGSPRPVSLGLFTARCCCHFVQCCYALSRLLRVVVKVLLLLLLLRSRHNVFTRPCGEGGSIAQTRVPSNSIKVIFRTINFQRHLCPRNRQCFRNIL